MRESRCVRIKEAAAYVGMSPPSYYAAVKRGLFPPRVPGTNLYDIKAIDAALDRLARNTTGEKPEPAPIINAYDAWKASRGEPSGDEGDADLHSQ